MNMRSRTKQLIFQSMYFGMALIGIVASIGFFEYTFESEFYVHFTNLSNYFCIGIMLAELIQTAKKEEDSYVTALSTFKFLGVLMIFLTFLVFNIMLAPKREPYKNFTVKSILFHVILPIMYIADWFLFYERKKTKWYYPFLAAIVPVVYVFFIYIRAWILDFNADAALLYPYFFLDLNTLGAAGVMRWVAILFVAFIMGGFLLVVLDHVIKTNEGECHL